MTGRVSVNKNKTVATPYTVRAAIKKGDITTRLSLVLMGAGNMARGQIVKGLCFLCVEIVYIGFMLQNGFYYLSMLPSLGDREQVETWNESKGVFEYVAGDNSLLLLLFGVVTVVLTALFIVFWALTVKNAYKVQCLRDSGKHINSFAEDVGSLFHTNLHILLMNPPMAGILAFTILPLIFMICMAFTNYSKVGDHLILFDWVGLENFSKVLNFKDSVGQSFWSVLSWTMVWAVFATGLNYMFGMLLAILINRKETRLKGLWRFCFILSIAVPQFVSLLVMRTMLQPEGAFNVMLRNMGLIDGSLPFFTNTMWARVTVIVINLWVGIPYTIMQVTGILHNIPAELFEAAKVDGANAAVTFFKITLPYMLFVTTPYLITQFTGNINNFSVIYLLSRGEPANVGSTAGDTDLLVTWLYKLTIDQQYYNLGAVIGIMTFVVLGIVALVTYHNTVSYKNEEGFQ